MASKRLLPLLALSGLAALFALACLPEEPADVAGDGGLPIPDAALQPPDAASEPPSDSGTPGPYASSRDAGPDAALPGPYAGQPRPDAGPDASVDAGTTLTVGTWNLEFFGSDAGGPGDEDLQLANAAEVLKRTGADLVAVEEIVDTPHFDRLKAQTGYSGFLANDAFVYDGWQNYSTGEQKVGILYRASTVTVQSAKVVLSAYGADFNGRPPLEVQITAQRGGARLDLTALVVHMAAYAQAADWQKRSNASVAMKGYLDTTWPSRNVIVLGDFNDDVDVSTASGYPSPYQNFVDDAASWLFVTKPLSDAGKKSYAASFGQMLDHHLVSNELAAQYVAASAEVMDTSFIANYASTTSDHYPVLARYRLGPPPPAASVNLTYPNGGEALVGYVSRKITWTSSNVSSVNLELSTDGGASWTTIATNLPSTPAEYCWRAPNFSTSSALVRITASADPTVTDRSAGTFSITSRAAGIPKVVVNEVLANEPGTDPGREFVELLNTESLFVDIGMWTVMVGGVQRYAFECGATLDAGKGLVLFAAASGIPSGLTNARATTSGLGLNEAGDTVRLMINATQWSDTLYWSTAQPDGVSLTRSPDGNYSAAPVLHTTANPSLSSSPGKRLDGSAF